MIVAIMGNIGSGKTTFAKIFEEHLGFKYVPEKKYELDFLDKFFDDIPKFFLPTQLAFLINKADQILNYHNIGENIVVDRSLYEDIYVFAKLWIDNYKIDKKEIELYKQLSNFILEFSPKPDVIIYLDCKPETSYFRIRSRTKRKYEDKYPDKHIERLFERYRELLKQVINENSFIILTFNSEKYNIRDIRVQNKVIDEFLEIIQPPEKTHQLTFDDLLLPKSKLVRQEPQNERLLEPILLDVFPKNAKINKKNKTLYLAAPFSAFANEKREDTNIIKMQFEDIGYGVIPTTYKKILLGIEKVITDNYNVKTILPHRDINKWGKKEIASKEVLSNIISCLDITDLVIAIPSNSIGVHIELGIALKKGIPIIVFEVEELGNSFFVKGFDGINNCLYFKVNTLKDILKCLKSFESKDFLSKFLLERE